MCTHETVPVEMSRFSESFYIGVLQSLSTELSIGPSCIVAELSVQAEINLCIIFPNICITRINTLNTVIIL
jgi:hypothetical protein